MNNKQGILYNKKKKKYVESMKERIPDSLENAKKTRAPLFNEVVEENIKNSNIGLSNCFDKCEATHNTYYKSNACNLGCYIKYGAHKLDEKISLDRPFSREVKYDLYRKELQGNPVQKERIDRMPGARTYIRAKYKNVRQPRKRYIKRFEKRYKATWILYPFIIGKRPVYGYYRPPPKRVLVRKPRVIKHPDTYRKCTWEETVEFPEIKMKTFSEDIIVETCDDFKTSNNVPDITFVENDSQNKNDVDRGYKESDFEYYRDYSPYELVSACKDGMTFYERKNCVVNTKGMDCNERINFGSVIEDKINSQEKTNELNKYINKSGNKNENLNNESIMAPTEGFSNACKERCNLYIKNPSLINSDNMKKDDDCYICEVKNNVFIRNDKARDEWLDNLFYIATKDNPLETQFSNLNNSYKQKKNQLNNLHEVDVVEENNKLKYINEKGKYPDLRKKYKTIYDKLNSMTYSEKRNATINAYLEDMNKKTPSKNIEYGIWLGLLVAAGVTTFTLIKD